MYIIPLNTYFIF